MKTIGIIGGMDWELTKEYYRIINQEIKKRLGRKHLAKCLIYSVDFEEFAYYEDEKDWNDVAIQLVKVASSLEKGGADFIIISNATLHKVADYVEENIGIPILHIAEATANQIKQLNLSSVGLVDIKQIVEQDFYRGKIESNDIRILTPNEEEQENLDKIIDQELIIEKTQQPSSDYIKKVIRHLSNEGAEGIITGNNIIQLLLKEEDLDIPLLNNTVLHAIEAVNRALDV